MATPEKSVQSMIELFAKCEKKYDLSEFLKKYPTSHSTKEWIGGSDIFSLISQASDGRINALKPIEEKDDGTPAQRAPILDALENFYKDSFEPIRKGLDGAAAKIGRSDADDKEREIQACYVVVPRAAQALVNARNSINAAKDLPISSFVDELSRIIGDIEDHFTSVADFIDDRRNDEAEEE